MVPSLLNGLLMAGRSVAVLGLCTLAVGCGSEAPSTDSEHGKGSVGVYRFPGESAQTALTAAFAPEAPASCEERREGACVLRSCPWSHGSTAQVQLDAGLITATSGGRQLSVEPAEERGFYPSSFGDFDLWEVEGGPIVIEASGGAIEPFRVELVGPNKTMIIEPPPAAMDSTVIVERGAPLFVAWEESKVGELLAVASFMGGGEYGSISCRFPASDGGALIPGELLAGFNPNDAPMRLTLGIGASEMVTAGGYEIEVVAYSSAATIDGRTASFSVELR